MLYELVEEQPEEHEHLKRRRPFDPCPNCQTLKNQVAVNERELKRLRERLKSWEDILASGGDPGDFMQAEEGPNYAGGGDVHWQ